MISKSTCLRLFFTEPAKSVFPAALMGAKLTKGLECLWLCLGFCAAMTALFSESYILFHRNHDCSGEGCPLCLLIRRVENFSRELKSAASCSGFSAASLLPAAFILKFVVFRFVPLSAVQLKVKMIC
jgi:hypothetical protein